MKHSNTEQKVRSTGRSTTTSTKEKRSTLEIIQTTRQERKLMKNRLNYETEFYTENYELDERTLQKKLTLEPLNPIRGTKKNIRK